MVPPNHFLVKPPVLRVIPRNPKTTHRKFQRENLHIPRILEAMELGQIDAAATTLVLRTSKYLGDDKTTRGLRKNTKITEGFLFLGERDIRFPVCVFWCLKRRKFCYVQILHIYVYICIYYGKLVAPHRGAMQKGIFLTECVMDPKKSNSSVNFCALIMGFWRANVFLKDIPRHS